ncbi:hypothetical protein Ahy_A04g021167 [Arachis hypogaea]|uniref:Pyrophosphate--fructose 6-phosphate 1-phosphotransferase subunit beta n=2 Tax=Arachis hypogaea TaxID=3818 RepID=A0A445DJS6_ARAHY|nr:hypothetical protein Ahy_A04g021167 [Arachis hypogaea]
MAMLITVAQWEVIGVSAIDPIAATGKEAMIELYMHDLQGGSSPTARPVTGLLGNIYSGQVPFAMPIGFNIPQGQTAVPNANGALPTVNGVFGIPLGTGLAGTSFAGDSSNNNNQNNAQLQLGPDGLGLGFGTITVIDDVLTAQPELGSQIVGKAQGVYVASSADGSRQMMTFTALFEGGEYGDSLNFYGLYKIGSAMSQLSVIGGTGKFKNASGFAELRALIPPGQGGFDMICSGRDKIETPEQFKQAEETTKKLDLDGLVVIGGDDSNTNACLLAENFRSKNLKTRVIGCPKTIDGDLKCKEVPTSFGFDTACKIYSEMIGNVMVDARSTGKYYHFVRLMGRAASHITLECALQTHPNITIIGEEVAAKKLTLKNVTDYIVDVICKRAAVNYNYGVILIPEGLIDFIPEVQQLIAELNEILAHDIVDEGGLWKKKLTDQSLKLFEFLPQAIQEQLMLERDPHGNVQVAKIETEKMLIQMAETELEKRKQEGKYRGEFRGQSHFFGYEGRCGLPTNFDATYCYALGYGAGALLHSGKTGLISSVRNLCAPVEDWIVGGTALTSLMDVERRHGKFKPVIKKAMVELQGAPFKKFASLRDEWALKNCYVSPGPIQFSGPGSDAVSHTLRLELESQA